MTHTGLVAYAIVTGGVVLLLTRGRITEAPTWVITRGILRGRWRRARHALAAKRYG